MRFLLSMSVLLLVSVWSASSVAFGGKVTKGGPPVLDVDHVARENEVNPQDTNLDPLTDKKAFPAFLNSEAADDVADDADGNVESGEVTLNEGESAETTPTESVGAAVVTALPVTTDEAAAADPEDRSTSQEGGGQSRGHHPGGHHSHLYAVIVHHHRPDTPQHGPHACPPSAHQHQPSSPLSADGGSGRVKEGQQPSPQVRTSLPFSLPRCLQDLLKGSGRSRVDFGGWSPFLSSPVGQIHSSRLGPFWHHALGGLKAMAGWGGTYGDSNRGSFHHPGPSSPLGQQKGSVFGNLATFAQGAYHVLDNLNRFAMGRGSEGGHGRGHDLGSPVSSGPRGLPAGQGQGQAVGVTAGPPGGGVSKGQEGTQEARNGPAGRGGEGQSSSQPFLDRLMPVLRGFAKAHP